MKQQANKKRCDRQFNIGDLVYLKLQPYRQSTVVHRKFLKLSAKFFGPYRILEKIGPVAYKLELPKTAKIHPVFHVSQLKQHVGPVVKQSPLPVLNDEGLLAKEPVRILDRRLVNNHGVAATEVLVMWKNTFLEDSTWEKFDNLMQRYPNFHS